MERQLVVFELGKEYFGVNIIIVDGIIKIQEITSVPLALDFVEGITNLRGSVLPVIDLRKRLGMPVGENTGDTRIIVVNTDDAKIGMIVDAVSEVLTILDETIEATPPVVSTIDTAFITGIAKLEDRLIILLDLDKVLSADEREALKEL